MIERRRRLLVVVFVVVLALGSYTYQQFRDRASVEPSEPTSVLGIDANKETQLANEALEGLAVKGRAPKTGYTRAQFGNGWADAGACDVRNFILKRDLSEVKTKSEADCTVLSGILNDPYTGKAVQFQRGQNTSDDVQIDHVVALSDAWQKGAQQLTYETRTQFANDSLNLVAVDGESNQKKSDSDAASWLPPNKPYRCRYIARQVAVKQKYKLWVTEAEKAAMKRVLSSCSDQRLPVVS